MRLTLTTFTSVDGVMQAPGGPNEDPSGGFEQGGWVVPYVDDGFGAFMAGVFDQADAFLLGRRTYDIFAAHWPRVDDPEDPIATKLNSLPKYVATQSLETAGWQGTTILSGDVVEQVAELKREPGRELQVHGSGALARTLHQAGLIDVYNLLTFPLVLGHGRRLFAEGAEATALKQVRGETTESGVAIGVYEPAGEPKYGSFELDPA